MWCSMPMPETPDRHTPLRSTISDATCTLRTNLSPDLLTSRERYTRSRDGSIDPFRARSKSKPRVKPQITANGSGMLAPHHIPTFVHRDDAEVRNNRSRLRNVRHISLGGVWSVGGRVAALPIQIHGVDSGTGDVLASGTNAPLVTANFIDTEAGSFEYKTHQARLAMALHIDQAQRILPVSPPSPPRSESS